MPLVAGIKQTFGLKSVLNIAAFVGTFAALTFSNFSHLRAVAAESSGAVPLVHIHSVSFDIRDLELAPPASAPLPPVPGPFDSELTLQEPQVTAAVASQTGSPSPMTNLPLGLFGSLEFRTNATKGIGAWRQALARLDNEQPLYEICDVGMLNCPPKFLAWRQLLRTIRNLPRGEQLARLNRGINKLISHGDDADIFRVRDYWAAPMEFLQTGGDCEDYTILKYASLLELGYRDRELRIVVATDTRRQQDHAVLAVAGEQDITILDSLTDTPLPHEKVRHYKPVYSVNRTNRWVHIATKQISHLSVAALSN